MTLPASIDTLYVMIVDRSGSMDQIRYETIMGMNEYLDTQKSKGVQNAYVSLYQFDSYGEVRITKTFDMVPLEKTRLLGLEDFAPYGGTPLYEAIGRIVTSIKEIVESAENPPSVIVQIITDGGNTDYLGWTQEKVAALTRHLEDEVKGWTFTYAGANQNAVAVAATMGISASNTIEYATDKAGETFTSMAVAASAYSLSNSTLRSVDKKARHTTKSIYADAGVDTSNLV